jgi:hypothetical protein
MEGLVRGLVFDIEQTGGEEFPQACQPVDVAEKLAKLLALAESQQFRVDYSDRIAPAKATSYRGVIRLVPGLDPGEVFPALLREVASQILYAIQRRTFVTRAIHQQETQAAAFVVCEALGLEAKTLSRRRRRVGTVTFDAQSQKIVVHHNWYETVSNPDEPREI